jgi:hypothetical protein
MLVSGSLPRKVIAVSFPSTSDMPHGWVNAILPCVWEDDTMVNRPNDHWRVWVKSVKSTCRSHSVWYQMRILMKWTTRWSRYWGQLIVYIREPDRPPSIWVKQFKKKIWDKYNVVITRFITGTVICPSRLMLRLNAHDEVFRV